MTKFTFSNQLAEQLSQSIEKLDSRSVLRTIKQSFDDGKISDKDAVMLCKPSVLDGILFSSVDTENIADSDIILNHSIGTPGAAIGRVVCTAEEADPIIEKRNLIRTNAKDIIEKNDYEKLISYIQNFVTDENCLKLKNCIHEALETKDFDKINDFVKGLIENIDPFILVLPETKPEFIRYIEEAAGVVTFQGGITSHAAIITRQKGKPAIIGCGNADLKNGEEITIDGAAGLIVHGKATIKPPEPNNPDLSALLEIADGLSSDKTHHITVKANADTPKDAEKARKLGAKGIGVARTEHMFFAEDRLPHMQAMIMAADEADRRKHLDNLATMQKDDFKGILQEMDGLPVTIRLLDAPLHEFVPTKESVTAIAAYMNITHQLIDAFIDHAKKSTDEQTKRLAEAAEKLKQLSKHLQIPLKNVMEAIIRLHESNPMLGFRGIRLLVTHPEICEMQVRSILQATKELKEEGLNPQPQIMLPMVSFVGEVEYIKKVIEKVGDDLGIKRTDYKIGIMTEVPSTAWEAKEFAQPAEFFSFGTNDFTQTTYGMSRDDLSAYTADLLAKGIVLRDPFQTIQEAAARGMRQGILEGKHANPALDVSVCGEHGGDPASIHTCQKIGVDTVSVSPPRIPVARLVAAQAMVEHELEVGSWQGRSSGGGKSGSGRLLTQ